MIGAAPRPMVAPEKPLVLTRTFNAPRPGVFEAWTSPARLAAWWGPHGFTNPRCEIDARPGGAIRIDMRAPDGAVFPMAGTVVEVVAPEKIVFTSAALGADGHPVLEAVTTVTLAERDGRTVQTVEARVVRARDEAAPFLAGMRVGWTQSLERLASHLGAR